MTRIEELARKLNQEILALEVVQEYQKYEKLVLNDEKLKQLEKELKVLQKKIVIPDFGNSLLIIFINDAGYGILRLTSIDGIRLPQVCIAESARYDYFG